MSTSARILQLLSLLQRHRYWAGSELADRLEVSERTVRRDVERLRELGYPVLADRGTGGGYQLAAGASLPPLVLDDAEAVAIAVGLGAATRSPAAGLAGVAEASVSALAKVTQVMPPRLRTRVEALRSVTDAPAWERREGEADVDVDVLTAAATAARDGERLGLTYTSAAGEVTERTVEPHALVPSGRRWYLLGFDLLRADWRTLRLDRVTTCTRTGQRFRHREVPGGDAAAYVRRSVRDAPRGYDVDVAVHAPVAVVERAAGGWATVTDHPDTDQYPGWARLTCSVGSVEELAWPAFVLGGAGAPFAVVSPPELRDLLGEWAVRFAAASAASGAASASVASTPGADGASR